MGNKVLRRRFIAIIAAFSVIMLLMWLIWQNTVFSHIRQNAEETVALAESSLVTILSDEFSRMFILSSSLSGSDYVQEFLAEQDAGAYYEKAEAVAEIVRKAAYPHTDTDSIITITAGGSFYRFTGSISAGAIKKIHDALQSGGLPAYSVTELDKTGYFCLVTPVLPRNSQTTQPAGYVVMLSNIAKVRRTLLGMNTISGMDAAVVLDDTILLSSNEELDGAGVSELYRRYGAVTVSEVVGTDLSVATALTKEALHYTERIFITTALFMLAALIIALCVLWRVMSAKMVGPMLTKSDNMQMGLLKTQINAHFIVNTVEAIESLAEQGETEKIAVAARNLALMLKDIHESDEEINIYDQLESLEYYIGIMNTRTGGKYSVDIDMDDVLVEYRIPAQILQPLVENAMTHGRGNKAEDCRLTIKGRIENGCVALSVSDNGKGMEPETVRALQEHLNAAGDWEYEEYKLKGVALVNIQKRIRTRYGDKYGITPA
jgi:hypothetical protein